MDSIIISGAGPVGLAAAVFLRRRGFQVRIFDPLLERNVQSRALAINPRTLELLDETGVAEKILGLGHPIHYAQLWDQGVPVAKVDLRILPGPRPFLVALSQAVTERLLTENLSTLGVNVERGWGLKSISQNPENAQSADRIVVKVENKYLNQEAEISGAYLLAADGAHSTIRQFLQIPFDGRTLKEDWYLADAYFVTDLDDNEAHIEFMEKDFNFYLRVVKNAQSETDKPQLWRIMSSDPDFLTKLRHGKIQGEPVWQSKFRISHRINRQLSKGRVFFMGDAAHIHSPVGARGMNLGIEDSWTFAKLLQLGQQGKYAEQRHRVDQQVVSRVEILSNVVMGRSVLTRCLRKLFKTAVQITALQKVIVNTIAGLDHPVD